MRKTLRAASGDTITVEFTETFVRPKTGEPMQGFGGEFWTMDGDRLAEWHLYWRGCPRNDAPPPETGPTERHPRQVDGDVSTNQHLGSAGANTTCEGPRRRP